MASAEKKIEKVAIVRCSSYEQKRVDKAVRNALDLIGFKFKKHSKVLIKPNVVGSFPKHQTATTTNPHLIEAVCKILKKNKCRIFIGDSPFTNPEVSFEKSGIGKIAKKYGKLVIFEQDKLAKVHNEHAKILRDFKISKTLKNVDLIINIPKLKTHKLTKYTGAIKNLYGVVLGGIKQKLHFTARGDKQFSKMLVDIYQIIKPELTIMDGIIGMEGEGPTAGNAVSTNLILASKNGIALDIAASKIIGLNPKLVYAIKFAVKRKLYSGFKFDLVGLKELPKFKFELPSGNATRTQRLLNRLFKIKPIVVDEIKCIKCGLCARKCPAKAIKLNPYPIINKKKCIRCYCCMEICPQHALHLKC